MAGKWHVEYTGGRNIKVYDDWVSDYGVIHDNGVVAFDFPERIPKTIKKKANALAKQILKGKLTNPSSIIKKLRKGIRGYIKLSHGRLIIKT